MMSMSPTQKLGSEKPSTEPVMMPRVLSASGRSPAQIPKGTPTTPASNIDTSASSSVAGMRSRMSPMADCPVRKLLPKSSRTACDMKIAYCSTSGLSRPKLARIASRSNSVASGLAIIDTGSPTTYRPRNTKPDMTAMTSSAWSRRRMMNASIKDARAAATGDMGTRRALTSPQWRTEPWSAGQRAP